MRRAVVFTSIALLVALVAWIGWRWMQGPNQDSVWVNDLEQTAAAVVVEIPNRRIEVTGWEYAFSAQGTRDDVFGIFAATYPDSDVANGVWRTRVDGVAYVLVERDDSGTYVLRADLLSVTQSNGDLVAVPFPSQDTGVRTAQSGELFATSTEGLRGYFVELGYEVDSVDGAASTTVPTSQGGTAVIEWTSDEVTVTLLT